MSVTFCAIDPSISCTALALLQVDGDKFKVIEVISLTSKSRNLTKWTKKTNIRDLFINFLDSRINDICFFVFENYSYGSVGQLADLGELGGMLKSHLHDHDKFFDVIAPSTVKKIVSGNGRASKDDVKNSLEKYISNFEEIVIRNNDESDAIAIGIAYALKMGESIPE